MPSRGCTSTGGSETASSLLVTVDEVHRSAREDLRELASGYQHMVSEGRDVALVAAGPPSSISDLLNDDVLTFLCRATPLTLGEVPVDEVAAGFEQTFREHDRRFEGEPLEAAAAATGGHPFTIQLVGCQVWRRTTGPVVDLATVEAALPVARARLGSTVHATALHDLSGVDRAHLTAMALDDAPSRTAEVARRLGRTVHYADKYRQRLLATGLIHAPTRGEVDFTVPTCAGTSASTRRPRAPNLDGVTASAPVRTTPAAPPTALADLTTLRVGGTPRRTLVATTEAELVEAVRDVDAAGEKLLLVGGGSNLLVADGPLAETAVLVRTSGVDVPPYDACGGMMVTVAAGHGWDDLVALTVGRGLSGMEALSGIPGSTGATPIQNVGAYGQEVADTIASVRCWDRREGEVRTLFAAGCAFGYRTSRFKNPPAGEAPGRYVVLSVTFQLRPSPWSAPVRYPELARRLGVEPGQRAPLAAARDAVLALRAGKGMVLDAEDPDTASAGSFFTNPVLDAAGAAALPDDAPRYDAGEGSVKTSAAWLVEHAGFGRGHGLPGPAAVSTKHALALTNRGDAGADDVLALARAVREGVRSRFGITLEPEPTLVGCAL